MAVGMSLRWPGLSLDQYDATMKELGLDDELPQGGIAHFAGELNGELRAFDVWESAEDFQAFAESRLAAATQAAGIEGEPQVEIFELHNTWVPEAGRVEQLAGGTSLPA
jgi:hypothetical protein